MTSEKLRQQILFEAARLMRERQETHLGKARIRAARSATKTWLKPAELPSEKEIRHQLRGMESRTTDDDRRAVFARLLMALESVQQSRRMHPEGDALYHSLQVFELTREAFDYDEELLTAALMHDVGKAIDPKHPVESGLAALEGWITPRTAWLIENLPDAKRVLDGSIGKRAAKRLHQAEDWEELSVLAQADRDGRVPGAAVPTLEEALDVLADLAGEP